MKLSDDDLPQLASRLIAERKRQRLSREQAGLVCNVSASFIRDAEHDPARCSFGKLLLLIQGLGLTILVTGWQDEPLGISHEASAPAESGPENP